MRRKQKGKELDKTLHYFIAYKPYGMICQFSPHENRPSLATLYPFPSDVYPVGRLDADSEGLLILTNDKRLNHLLLDPSRHHSRTYLVQVEGDITGEAIEHLCRGVEINLKGKKYHTLLATAVKLTLPPTLPERTVPIRSRKNIPVSWIRLTLREGKNRQIRKMTATTGFPTLRLIRIAIEDLCLGNLKPGEVQQISREKIYTLLKIKQELSP